MVRNQGAPFVFVSFALVNSDTIRYNNQRPETRDQRPETRDQRPLILPSKGIFSFFDFSVSVRALKASALEGALER
jgi:hypothetical protein